MKISRIPLDENCGRKWKTFATTAEELISDIKEIISRSKAIYGSNYKPRLVLAYDYV